MSFFTSQELVCQTLRVNKYRVERILSQAPLLQTLHSSQIAANTMWSHTANATAADLLDPGFPIQAWLRSRNDTLQQMSYDASIAARLLNILKVLQAQKSYAPSSLYAVSSTGVVVAAQRLPRTNSSATSALGTSPVAIVFDPAVSRCSASTNGTWSSTDFILGQHCSSLIRDAPWWYTNASLASPRIGPLSDTNAGVTFLSRDRAKNASFAMEVGTHDILIERVMNKVYTPLCVDLTS